MRLTTITLSALVLLAVTSPVHAQAPADFNGRWVIAVDAAGRGGAAGGGAQRGGGGGGGGGGRGVRADLGTGWGSNITITQDVAVLAIQYAFFTQGDMQPPVKLVYKLDGSEVKNTLMMGRGMQEQLSRTSWDGAKLVITTVHNIADPSGGAELRSETKHVLSLESPTVLLVETTRSGVMGGGGSVVVTRYGKGG